MSIKPKDYARFFVIFLILFGELFGPNFYISGISLRVITSAICVLLIAFQWRTITTDRVFKVYIFYILCIVFASAINGAVNNEYFNKQFLNWHLPCLILYLIIPSYVSSCEHIKIVCNLLLLFLVADVLLSLGQYANISLAWDIGNTINAHASETSESFMERNDISMGFLGMSIINGMCASVVDNGYLIATFFPLLLIGLYNTKTLGVKRLFFYLLLGLTVAASFAIQQRMGFVLIVLFIGYHLWCSNQGGLRIILMLVVIMFIVVGNYMLSNMNLGRMADLVDEDRANTYFQSVSLIFSDSQLFWVGGESYYRNFFEHTPHNTLIGAWVYSGIFGFTVFSLLLFYIIRRLLPSFSKGGHAANIIQYSLAAGCFIFIAYSMTHSTGIHNGKALYFWLLYGLYNKNEILLHKKRESSYVTYR